MSEREREGEPGERPAPAMARAAAGPADQLLALQRTAGNRAVGAVLRSRKLQRLDQSLPYVGPLLSYINPLNQAARLGVGRALTADEKKTLDDVFGASLVTSIIRIRENSTILAAGKCYRTTGNFINIPDTTISRKSLIHEAAHVWQHQNGIPLAYGVSALSSQLVAQLFGGDWEKAYDYRPLEAKGVPWPMWNAEQQATWIADHEKLPDWWWSHGPTLLPEVKMAPGAEPYSGHR
jgi:hypothetical protein